MDKERQIQNLVVYMLSNRSSIDNITKITSELRKEKNPEKFKKILTEVYDHIEKMARRK